MEHSWDELESRLKATLQHEWTISPGFSLNILSEEYSHLTQWNILRKELWGKLSGLTANGHRPVKATTDIYSGLTQNEDNKLLARSTCLLKVEAIHN